MPTRNNLTHHGKKSKTKIIVKPAKNIVRKQSTLVKFSSRSEDDNNFSVDIDSFFINSSILSKESALSMVARFTGVSGLRCILSHSATSPFYKIFCEE